MKIKRKNSGFTLLELVIVITIISILAATAMNKFIGLDSDAKKAKMSAFYGSIKSAANVSHAACLTNMSVSGGSTCTATGGYIVAEGDNISMFNGYPDSNVATGIISAANIDYTNDGLNIVTYANGVGVLLQAAKDPNNCSVVYNNALSHNAPIITLNTSGC